MLPNDADSLYHALLSRNPAYDGLYYVGVRTTGVYCRLTCPARKPLRENVEFHATIAAARAAGFRPCRRCRPEDAHAHAHPDVPALRRLVDDRPECRWTAADLEAAGYSPSTMRRAFRRAYGITFAQYARARRLARGVERLRGGAPVIDAQLEAGYGSASGFREAIGRLLRGRASRVAAGESLVARWFDTPIGAMLGVASDAGLHLLEFAERRGLPRELERLQDRHGGARLGDSAVLSDLAAQLARYFADARAPFKVPLAEQGSAFERSVWRELRAIPCGEVRTYGEIALAVARPTAVRAVARANGANTVAILVPCHRVIGADGSLTGYGGRLWRKQWLLEHERRHAGTTRKEQR